MQANPSVSRRGVALVIVLVFVVLLSVFILSFFTNSQNELTAAQSFSGQISAQQLSETAVSLVQGQIREATSRENVAWASQPGMIRTYGESETGGISDKADAFFKLYSSDDMIVGRKEMPDFMKSFNEAKLLGGEIPFDPTGNSGWDSQPALFTNLNEPVALADPPIGAAADSDEVSVKFPIIDGHDIRTVTLASMAGAPNPIPSRPVLSYDALDDKGRRIPDGVPDIEGFAIDPATVKYDENLPLSATNTPVPMPVKWLYVLRDGTLTAPSGVEQDQKTQLGTRATWQQASAGVPAPTKDNPIVGRIAFWADDDTCKVNINTAGGFNVKDADRTEYKFDSHYPGSYWDQPRTFTTFDYGLAKDNDLTADEDGEVIRGGLSITQPVAKEYQRYPGHPATTSLALLFKDLLNSEQMYSILPRLVHGGTRNGTVRFFGDKSDIDREDEDEVTQPLVPKRDRIFASVDEFLFGPRDTEADVFRPTTDARLRANNSLKDSQTNADYRLAAGQNAISPELLERMRFFLTAHSRSPELNLFGKPRVTIWPSYPDPERLNASDRLLNFCSTLGPKTRPDGTLIPVEDLKLFEFQRSDPYSPTNDWDGTGPSHAKYKNLMGKSGGQTRNQFIYKYLQTLTEGSVPGFSGKGFAVKYGNLDRDQILTEIFDYMRTVNMRDSTRDKAIYPQNPKDPPAAEWKLIERYKFAPMGVVVPITIKGTGNGESTRGFGRFPTISEAALVLYHTGYGTTLLDGARGGIRHFKSLDKPQNLPGAPDGLNDALKKAGKKNPKNKNMDYKDKEGVTHNTVSAFLLLEMFNPMMGYAPTKDLNVKSADRVRYVIEVAGLDAFEILGGSNTVVSRGSLNFFPKAEVSFNRGSAGYWHGRNMGGTEGCMHLLLGNWNEGQNMLVPHKYGTNISTTPQDFYYQLQGGWPGVYVLAPTEPEPALGDNTDQATIFYNWHDPAKAANWQKVNLRGGTLDILVKFGQQGSEQVVRTLQVKFPSTTVPMPTDLSWQDAGGFVVHPAQKAVSVTDLFSTSPLVNRKINPEAIKRFGDRLLAPDPNGRKNWGDREGFGGVFDSLGSSDYSGSTPPGYNSTNRWRQIVQPGDVIRSVQLSVLGDDPRIAAINDEKSIKLFNPHPDYDNQAVRHAQTLRTAAGPAYLPGPNPPVDTANNAPPATTGSPYWLHTKFGKMATFVGTTKTYVNNNYPDMPYNVKNGVRMSVGDPTLTGNPGDFDTGLGNLPDGAFTGKADEGNPVFRTRESYKATDGTVVKYWRYPHPYFNWDYEETFDTFFTPNRQTPSAVVFGSLPAGKNAHWTTLSFSPVTASEAFDKSGVFRHPGRKDGFVRDHLLLDLFNMPIVEPYAISEPFSTAGKVNMNFPIMPFGNIERNTAFRAALHSVRVSAFPAVDVATYKTAQSSANGVSVARDVTYRYPVDRDLTMHAFRAIFDKFKTDQNGGFFKSATEICDRALYPRETTAEPVRAGGPVRYSAPGMSASKDPDHTLKTTFWNQNSLTGDNMREKPYSDLYPRLTTKSNTYTVHIRAQALRQTVQSATDSVWDEKKDRVIGEYRGSSTIERFIDPEDARFDPKNPNVNSKDRIDVDKDPLEKAYRFRVVNTKRFVP